MFHFSTVISALSKSALLALRLAQGGVFQKTRTVSFALASVLSASAVMAHPHVWIDSQYEVAVDTPSIEHIQADWSLDVFTSTSLLEDYDTNGDGKFTGKEKTELTEALHNFGKYGYFVHLKVDGKPIKPKKIEITGFGMKKQMMWMTLNIDLPAPVNLEKSKFSLAFGDDTYFFAMVPLEEGLVRLSGKLAESCTPAPRDAKEQGIESWVDLTCSP